MENFGGAGGYPTDFVGGTMQKNTSRRHKLSMGARDPLLKKAHRKVWEHTHNKENETTPPSNKIMQLAALSVGPFAVYVLIMFVTSYAFYWAPASVFLTFAIAATANVFLYLLVEHCTRKRAGKWKRWLGVYGALAACSGLVVGLLIHYQYMLYYWKYSNMMKYSNVAASQPALQFEDAGSLLFTEGTTLDRSRAVGYRHIRSQSTLCVAPVVDGQMAPTDPIVFFAVGMNCCGWRASFNCDDAAVGGTRGGLLMLEPNHLVSPAMEWTVDKNFNFEAFQEAIDLQKSVFAVSAAKNFRYLMWVKDPAEKLDDFRKRGMEFGIISCALYALIVGVCVAYDLITEDARQKRAATEFMRGGSAPAENA